MENAARIKRMFRRRKKIKNRDGNDRRDPRDQLDGKIFSAPQLLHELLVPKRPKSVKLGKHCECAKLIFGERQRRSSTALRFAISVERRPFLGSFQKKLASTSRLLNIDSQFAVRRYA